MEDGGTTTADHLRVAHWLARRANVAEKQAASSLRMLHRSPDRRLDQLSTGNRRKVRLIAASLSSSQIVLLDSPTAFLDSESYDVAERIVTGMAEDRRAVVIATTDPEIVLRLDSSAIYTVAGGRLHQV